MSSFRFIIFAFLVVAAMIMALPEERSFEMTPAQRRQSRREGIPEMPPRPEGVVAGTFHGSQFQFFDELGFVAGSPGVEAAPVFLYSRTQSIFVWHASSL